MSSISAIVIAANEEQRIDTCLRSLAWADEIILIDGESKDRTLEVASHYTQKIHTRPFDNFANQKNYGIDLAKSEWIFSIDADEVVTSYLAESLRAVIKRRSSCDGFLINRANILFGKRLRFGGQGADKVLRFFRKEKGRFDQPVHEKVKVDGKVGQLEGELMHLSSSTISDYLKKLNPYTSLEAQLAFRQGLRPTILDLCLRPSLRFLYYYVLRLGFLDGYEGFLFHGLSSFHHFLKLAKVREIHERAKKI